MAKASVRIDLNGMEDVLRAVEKVENALLPPKITQSVGKGADVFVEGAQMRAPEKDGTLKRSIRKYLVDPYTWAIEPDTIYAGVQEFGATIPGRPLLALPGSDGAPKFVEEVTIPASPYMGPTFTQDKSLAVKAVKESIIRDID